MSPRVTPFPTLPILVDGCGKQGNVIGAACCVVLAINRHIAFKCPWKTDKEERSDTNQEDARPDYFNEGKQAIVREKSAYARIQKTFTWRLPLSILQPCLIVPQGIFMPRMKCNLQKRLLAGKEKEDDTIFSNRKLINQPPITPSKKALWIKQLVSAAAWLERIGHTHGDLRPANILIDYNDNLVVADLGSSVPLGSSLMSGADTYCPLVFQVGTYLSEQYALGWCMYTILQGKEPDEFELPLDWYHVPMNMDLTPFPSTVNKRFGKIIDNCWHLRYPSIAALASAVKDEYSAGQSWLTRSREYLREAFSVLAFQLRRPWLVYMMQKKYKELIFGSYNWEKETWTDGISILI